MTVYFISKLSVHAYEGWAQSVVLFLVLVGVTGVALKRLNT